MSTFFGSCGCAVPCDENDSHCPECKDPIAPTLEKDTEPTEEELDLLHCESFGRDNGIASAVRMVALKLKTAKGWIDSASGSEFSSSREMCAGYAKHRIEQAEAYLRGAMEAGK